MRLPVADSTLPSPYRFLGPWTQVPSSVPTPPGTRLGPLSAGRQGTWQTMPRLLRYIQGNAIHLPQKAREHRTACDTAAAGDCASWPWGSLSQHSGPQRGSWSLDARLSFLSKGVDSDCPLSQAHPSPSHPRPGWDTGWDLLEATAAWKAGVSRPQGGAGRARWSAQALAGIVVLP